MKKTAAKEETKQALIQAFWKLYREKRIEKITVGEIAAVAGTTASLLFWLRLPDRPPAETYLSALHSIDSAAAERLLAKLRK